MVDIHRLVVGQLQTNCYLVIDQEVKEAMVIDPGDDADYIIRIISDLDLNPTKIIATHGHFDHVLAAMELKLAYNIPFMIHKADEFLLARTVSSARHFIGIGAGPHLSADKYLPSSNFVKLGATEFEVIETPGHTPGSVSFYSRKDKAVFVGDVVFSGGGVGRTDFSYSSEKKLEKSIKRITKLPKETTVYTGHGETTTVYDIKRFF